MDEQQQQRYLMTTAPSVSLREYMQVQFDDFWRLIQERARLNEREGERALASLNARLEQMNEIRNQLGTQRAEFATIERLEAAIVQWRLLHDALAVQVARDVDALRDRLDAEMKSARADRDLIRDAVNSVEREVTSINGRIAGAGVIIFIASIVLQVIFYLLTHPR